MGRARGAGCGSARGRRLVDLQREHSRDHPSRLEVDAGLPLIAVRTRWRRRRFISIPPPGTTRPSALRGRQPPGGSSYSAPHQTRPVGLIAGLARLRASSGMDSAVRAALGAPRAPTGNRRARSLHRNELCAGLRLATIAPSSTLHTPVSPITTQLCPSNKRAGASAKHGSASGAGGEGRPSAHSPPRASDWPSGNHRCGRRISSTRRAGDVVPCWSLVELLVSCDCRNAACNRRLEPPSHLVSSRRARSGRSR